MIDKKIIYPLADGKIAIITPCDCGLSIAEIANKDVPSGTKYKIVDPSQLPEDRTARETWTFDFSEYDGIGGAE